MFITSVILGCCLIPKSCRTHFWPMDCVAYQASLSIEFPRQEYWRGLPFPSPGDLPNSGIKPRSPVLQADSLPTELQGKSSFRIDWFDLLAVQGILKSLYQHHSSKASIFWSSAFFMVQLSHPYMTTGKTIALTL